MQSKFFNALLAAAFVSTIVGARIFSWILPRVHWEPVPGMHIHHYVYGIFILTAAGYLALIFKGEGSTLWIALLYGLGVGLTFDEFGMWLNPPFVRGVRWNTNGIAFVLVAIALIGLLPVLKRSRTRNISDSSKSEPQPRQDVVADFSSRS